jgi:peptide/nickel transport system substrate-binding protein
MRRLTLFLLACIAAASIAVAQTPQRGGTLLSAMAADPTNINPDLSTGGPDLYIGCMIYEGLVRFGKGFKIEPLLAKSWEISSDGLDYTFHLVEANWHDGKPFTSEDVKYTLTEVSPKYGPYFLNPSKVVQSIDTPDARTVRIKLSKPFGPFLFSLACDQNTAILPAHVFRGTDAPSNPASTSAPVGTGPFKIAEWVRGDHITLVRNDKYWQQGRPYLDRIIAKFIGAPSSRILALQAGELDYIEYYWFPLDSYKLVANDKRFQTAEVSYPTITHLLINTKQPPLDNPKVRQALMVALDRNYIQKNVFFGLGQPAVSTFDSRIEWAYNPKVNYEKMYPYDPAKAKAMLDEAGVKPGADGTRFTINFLFDSTRPDFLQAAQAIQRFWQDVGVKVNLQGAERAVTLKRVYTDYDFGVTLQTYTTSGDPALGIARAFVTESIKQGSNFNNVSRYSKPEVDDLFNKGRDASSREERAKYYYRVQEILAQDLPTLTLHQDALIDVASVRVHNIFSGGQFPLWDIVWMDK